MAQALPSFVELLASLDLESDESSEVQHYARYPTSPSFISSSPSSSLPSSGPSSQTSPRRFLTSPGPTSSFATPSPSIIISHPSPVESPTHSRRRSNSNRYNPYVAVPPQNVFARRRSLPGDLDHTHDVQKRNDSIRASSASPHMRRASLGEPVQEHETRLSSRRIPISEANQPISSFVRRRLPHGSPQSPKFSKAVRRSSSPTDNFTPVTLPSLPPLPPISMGASPPAPSSYPGHSRLPPISIINRRSPTPAAEGTGLPSRESSRTPKPASRNYASIDLGSNRISHHSRAAHKHHRSSP